MAVKLGRFLLFASLLCPTLAVPVFETAPIDVPTHDDYAHTHSRRVSTGSSPFRRLRNSIIERIWDVPKRVGVHIKDLGSDLAAPARFRKRYGNDVVLRFTIRSEDEAKAFSQATETLFIDVWGSFDDRVDIRISRDMVSSFLALLPSSLHNSHIPLTHDLAQAVYDTYPTSFEAETWRTRHSIRPQGPHDLFFTDYQPLSVVYPWLRLLSSIFPDVTEIIQVGTSAEGRDINALRIGIKPDDADPNEPRQTILITAGTHAREWISVSTATYIAYEFLTRLSHDTIVNKILTHYDIIFIPILNPDGYEYTWSTDRLWRKTRQSTSLPFCPGFDFDRTFPFNWDGDVDADNPCTESYAGTEPFQSVEAKALADWAQNYTRDGQHQFAAYFDLHSYSQEILYPYSYSCDDQPNNLEDLEEIALGLSKQFRLTTGRSYGVSSACEGNHIMGPGLGGSALDYFYHDLNVKIAFQIKLRDQGTYGFLLPRHEIVPTGREAYAAMVGFGKWILGNRGIESFSSDDNNDDSDVERENGRADPSVAQEGEGGEVDDEPVDDQPSAKLETHRVLHQFDHTYEPDINKIQTNHPASHPQSILTDQSKIHKSQGG